MQFRVANAKSANFDNFDFQTGMRPSSCMELGHRSQF